MALQTLGTVMMNKKVKSLYFLLEIDCPPIAHQIKPGQFVMVKVSNNQHPMLRRPFSIYKAYPADHSNKRKRGRLTLLYKKVGKGTQRMTELRKGQRVDIIGPLGNGFSLSPLPFPHHHILVGGGVGIVSLYPLAEFLTGRKLSVFIGGKSQEDILCVDDFKKLNLTIFLATEDGSLGFKGTVIDLFLSQLKKFNRNEFYNIYACGPVKMLEGLAKRMILKRFDCQASLESRMGCGFGACWGCTVKTKDSKTPYQRVCKEGPVFNLKDIAWE